jgi:hypothetical protein
MGRDGLRWKMPYTNLRASRSMLPEEPKGWKKLWEAAQREKDAKKLAELIDQMNQLLTEHERAAAEETKSSARRLPERPKQ